MKTKVLYLSPRSESASLLCLTFPMNYGHVIRERKIKPPKDGVFMVIFMKPMGAEKWKNLGSGIMDGQSFAKNLKGGEKVRQVDLWRAISNLLEFVNLR